MRRIAALLILSVAGIASSVHAQTISWSQVFNGPSEPPVGATLGSTEDPRAIAVDAAGNIFAGGVTQSFENATGGVKLKFVPHDDFVVITYDGAGQQLWGSVFDFPTLGDVQSSPATRPRPHPRCSATRWWRWAGPRRGTAKMVSLASRRRAW